jgi:ubiquinone/menaquinone biosynthesis C-methylase UbiE
MSLTEIDNVLSATIQKDCCLSAGEILNFVQPQPDDVCVNLGSGNGNDVIWMAKEAGSNGYVYGIDLSENMIKKSFNNAESLRITNVDFIKSTYEKIKLGNEIAQLVISDCMINRAVNYQAVWNEIYRILKKEGHFVVSDIYTVSSTSKYGDRTDANTECYTRAITRGKYIEMIYNAGFTSVRILKESEPFVKGNVRVVSFTVTGEKPGEKKSYSCRR